MKILIVQGDRVKKLHLKGLVIAPVTQIFSAIYGGPITYNVHL